MKQVVNTTNPLNNKATDSYVRIIDKGDTIYLQGEKVGRKSIERENERLTQDGKTPAKTEPIITTINKIISSSGGFLANVSFDDTPRKLSNAALEGRIDYLKGIQENVILGRLIPVGTGHPKYTA